MTTYTWPSTLIPNSASLQWLDSSVRFVSPFTGSTRTYSRPGGRWRLTMEFHGLKPEKAQQLEAFIWRLNGMQHRATIPDFAYRRQATGTGTPIVSGSGQTGRVLLTGGWAASATVMKAGDRFTVNGQMLVAAADATTGGTQYLLDEDGNQILDESDQPIELETGEVQIFLTAPLRSSPSAGASLNITQPTATYLLAERAEVAAQPGVFKGLTLVFEEAIDA